MINAALYSSASDLWETPQHIFDQYNNIYHFDIDVCAIPENAKCEKFYTPEDDGLLQKWEGVCWCNPPYGKEIEKWCIKAALSDATVVMLIPARTDTKWFHDWVLPYAEIQFVRGRLKFGNAKAPAPFPSLIAIYDRREEE